MRVFISWSGDASRDAAVALHSWLPKVLQDVQPFVSSKDIDKGEYWATRLQEELLESAFGVICLTKHNLRSPWLHYEAGAISSSVKARVCPILFGCHKADVDAPFKQLQLTEFAVEDFVRLMSSMNKALSTPISDSILTESVQTWWPKLENAIGKINFDADGGSVDQGFEPAKPRSTEAEKLDEILHRIDRLEMRYHRSAQSIGASERTAVAQERLIEVLMNHHLDIDSGSASGNRHTVNVREPLEFLDPWLEEALKELCQKLGLEIFLSSPGKSFSIDRDEATELPF